MATEDVHFRGVVAGWDVGGGLEVAEGADNLAEVASGGGLGLAGVGVHVLGDVVAVAADVGQVSDDALVLGCGGGVSVGLEQAPILFWSRLVHARSPVSPTTAVELQSCKGAAVSDQPKIFGDFQQRPSHIIFFSQVQ